MLIAPPADLPDWARRSVNLADPRLGARALYASDDFFADVSRMLNPEPAVFIPGKYDDNGKWMDGWETRRKRTAGHDWCLVKLARPGVIYGFDVDTAHFTGNYAPAVAIEAVSAATDDPDELAKLEWTPVLASTGLGPNAHHVLKVESAGTWTHLRVHIYPDGGIARLRVYGRPQARFDGAGRNGLHDLAALENGGYAVAWNDSHYGSVANLLLPGRGVDMGDGWETRRRREPGNDWCIVALGAPGSIARVELDTAHYKGNYPDRASIQAARVEGGDERSIVAQSMFWPILLPEQKLSADAIHEFAAELAALGTVTHVRINVIPDGGLSRVRLWGTPAA
ncbi:allantoicase [Pseudothauera nasutitermitis]|uniref:Probable allantoicase n=1 Tax=Pseudothauera nasutitermitis TaxID=2565930 RepID=A0A4S4B1T8_9RHOO|nr:allantoicase [Pseudothauera nasutitermitis]THF66531.1 allantoicase [Pseudothauera nasutitermitis]